LHHYLSLKLPGSMIALKFCAEFQPIRSQIIKSHWLVVQFTIWRAFAFNVSLLICVKVKKYLISCRYRNKQSTSFFKNKTNSFCVVIASKYRVTCSNFSQSDASLHLQSLIVKATSDWPKCFARTQNHSV